MMELNFLLEEKIEKKNNICINMFCYENQLTFPTYVSGQIFENSMDLLLVTDGDKSHYVYIIMVELASKMAQSGIKYNTNKFGIKRCRIWSSFI